MWQNADVIFGNFTNGAPYKMAKLPAMLQIVVYKIDSEGHWLVWIFLETKPLHTIIEDSVYIQAVCGTGFVVGAASDIGAELSGSSVIDNSGIAAADLVCDWQGKTSKE